MPAAAPESLQAVPLAPPPGAAEPTYPCPFPFSQFYMIPRRQLDLRFCSYHSHVLMPDQKAVLDEGLPALGRIMNTHPELQRRRSSFMAGDFEGAGCSPSCYWLNKFRTTGAGYKLSDYQLPDGSFAVKHLWLTVGPDCNITCRYCLEPSQFEIDYKTCDPRVMDLCRDFIRQGGEVLLTGGEPFLPRFRLLEILRQLIEWGDAKGRLQFHTNATYLNPEAREIVLRAPVFCANISMDTLRPQLFEFLRRGAKFHTVWDNVRALRRERDALGRRDPNIMILCAVMKANCDHIRETVDGVVAEGLGISLNALFRGYFSPDFCDAQGLHQLTRAELENLHEQLLGIERDYGPSGPVAYQGILGQTRQLLDEIRTTGKAKQVILGGTEGGHAPRKKNNTAAALSEAREADIRSDPVVVSALAREQARQNALAQKLARRSARPQLTQATP
jgi:sulfatase maturation enzyme AslB (radical SAM superfamily)